MNTITATFLIWCEDWKGIPAAVTNFFYQSGLNNLICQQYTDVTRNQYCMRLKLDHQGVKAHLESRIIEHENRTVVFSGASGM